MKNTVKKIATPAILAIVALMVTKYSHALATTPDIHLMPSATTTALRAVCILVVIGFWVACGLEIQNIWKKTKRTDVSAQALQ